MSETFRKRLVRELKQSPGKAAILGIGAVVAGFVWGPRLLASVRSEPGAGRTAAGAAAERAGIDADGRRDPAAIRAEFIRISEEARGLRELARAVEAFEVLHDPFEAEAAPVPVAPVASSARTERDEAEDDEHERAAALRLTAVFTFPRARKAVLDGEVVEVGDEVRGFAVVEIAERSMVLGGRFGTYRIAMSGAKEEEEEER